MTEQMTAWLGFRYAAEIVERTLGCSWGAAQKELLDACEAGEMLWQGQLGEGPSVADVDFYRWLELKTKKDKGGKQPRINAALERVFKGSPIPDPKNCPRHILRADLLKLDPTLDPLDLGTLKTAIDDYNRSIRNDPKPTVSD